MCRCSLHQNMATPLSELRSPSSRLKHWTSVLSSLQGLTMQIKKKKPVSTSYQSFLAERGGHKYRAPRASLRHTVTGEMTLMSSRPAVRHQQTFPSADCCEVLHIHHNQWNSLWYQCFSYRNRIYVGGLCWVFFLFFLLLLEICKKKVLNSKWDQYLSLQTCFDIMSLSNLFLYSIQVMYESI